MTLALCYFVAAAYSQATEDYQKTLKQMLELSGSKQAFVAGIKQMISMYKQTKTGIPDDIWDEMGNEMKKTSIDELVTMLTPVYQKHLTQDDLLKIIEFYKTPTGKKFASKTPLITQESMQVGQQWGMKVGAALEKKLKEKGY